MGGKKSSSEKKVSIKQLIEESDDDDEVISYTGDNNSTDNLSELDDEMKTGSINDNFRNAFYFATKINLHTFLLFGVSPSIHKKCKLQTTNYCCQKLPFRCFSVLSSLQGIYFLFMNNTFLFNSVTFFVCRQDNWKWFYGKMLALFQPTKTRGRNTRKVGYLHLRFKNSPYFQKTKNKKKFT